MAGNLTYSKYILPFKEFVCKTHQYSTDVTKASLTKNGIVKKVCDYCGDTKKTTTFLGTLIDDVKNKFKTIFAYLTASFGWQEIFQQIRQGFTYVKEIDSALTELRKVTDQTEAEYNQFL